MTFAVSEDLSRRAALDLGEVTEYQGQLELPGQRAGHPAARNEGVPIGRNC